ncbi:MULTISPECIES: hypothetical protein [unclassified Dietzia]|uniref:hypothetical protein n=1 Tax=Dietzia TaxID=37914 RepID=UPI0015FB481A|nr:MULTISPECIES: hypothetical protein [unclassified Dietzia]MBB1040217.1 hypothetical protein [Dietzia sp. Cai40]MBB1043322.1 hypothetical protein [Dietzia sp. DQ11-44]MBB1058525.1 hypothetical protein [Dietzia sp. B19]
MSETPKVFTEEAIRALFDYADSKVTDERLAAKLADYTPLLEIANSEPFQPLGETPPATAFNADWN